MQATLQDERNPLAGETRVLKHFQARMPYGLFVPDLEAT